MPDWTAEVIWWVAGAGGVGLILGWLFGRFIGGKVPYRDYEHALDQERIARRELNDARSARQGAESELHRLRQSHATTTGELDATQRLLHEARADAESARAQTSDELEGLNASLQNELEAARLRYAELHGSQTRVSGDLESAETRIAELNEIQDRMSDHLADAQARIESFETRTGATSDELFITRARMSDVEGKLALALTTLRTATEGLGHAHERLTGERTFVQTEDGAETIDLRDLPAPPADDAVHEAITEEIEIAEIVDEVAQRVD